MAGIFNDKYKPRYFKRIDLKPIGRLPGLVRAADPI